MILKIIVCDPSSELSHQDKFVESITCFDEKLKFPKLSPIAVFSSSNVYTSNTRGFSDDKLEIILFISP